jgi:hypothetical protein
LKLLGEKEIESGIRVKKKRLGLISTRRWRPSQDTAPETLKLPRQG